MVEEKTPGGLELTELQQLSPLSGGQIQIASRLAFGQYHHREHCFARVEMDFQRTAVMIEMNAVDKEMYVLQDEMVGS